jgi:hypothetical protein
MRRLLERLTIRLWLVAALLMAVTPGKGLVVCVAPEGSYSIELSFEKAGCSGCPEMADAISDANDTPGLADPADCPCSDYPVITGNADARFKPTPLHADLGAFARVPVSFVASIAPDRARVTPTAAWADLGIDPGLIALRTVVLRV